MLLETLIAVLIFSIGVLALVGLQATAIKQVADAKLRSDASYLANQIISQIWVDRSNLANYNFNTAGTDCSFSGNAAADLALGGSKPQALKDWFGSASSPGTVWGSLPGTASTLGYVQIIADSPTGLVTVTLCWRAPQETQIHNFRATALISG